jgi:hypothetical protein
VNEHLDFDPDAKVLVGEYVGGQASQELSRAAGPSPLDGAKYAPEAVELWRWTESATDDTIGAFVRFFVQAERPERAHLTSCLTMDDLYQVLTYARRRALVAIRTGESTPLVDAFDALSAMDVERIDERDFYDATMLASEAASYTDTTAAAAARGAIGRADEEVSEIIAEYVENEDGADLAEMCGLRVVDTATGRLLLRDEDDPFEPDHDLTGVVLALAAATAQEGSYHVSDVSVANTLPPVWVGEDSPAAQAVDRVTGGCRVGGERISGDRIETSLTIWLMEAATAEDASLIAVAAEDRGSADTIMVAHQVDRLVAVIIAHGWAKRTDENVQSLARFRPLVDQVLRHAVAR